MTAVLMTEVEVQLGAIVPEPPTAEAPAGQGNVTVVETVTTVCGGEATCGAVATGAESIGAGALVEAERADALVTVTGPAGANAWTDELVTIGIGARVMVVGTFRTIPGLAAMWRAQIPAR